MFDRTLIITPHFDDETIGCGGLISKLMEENKELRVLVIADHEKTYNYSVNRVVGNQERYSESAEALKILGVESPESIIHQLKGYPDSYLDQCSLKLLITAIDEEINEFQPTAVLFPYSSHHQDHQIVYTASVAALRPTVSKNFIKFKAAYEYPYITTSWNSSMTSDSRVHILLDDHHIEKKKKALQCYKSQLDRDSRDILSVEAIINLAKLRGTEVGHYWAESFYPMSIIF